VITFIACSVHYPEQKAYKLSDMFVDLLGFAARFLVLGGRLVYWIPVIKSEYVVYDIS
jgi:tRNA (guanine10-N2)-methyltransferase